MSKLDAHTIQMFMTKLGAFVYAWRAQHNGFDRTEIVRESDNWLLTGGRWSVKISDPVYRAWKVEAETKIREGLI